MLDVSSWLRADDEWLGEQEKEWLVEPTVPHDAPERRWLFKPSRRNELPGRAESSSRLFTWFDAQSEWIAHQLATSIDVPSADIHFARRDGAAGAISRSVKSPDEDMQSGDVFLSGLLGRHYVPNAEKARNRTGHQLDAIGRVLEGLEGPVSGGALTTGHSRSTAQSFGWQQASTTVPHSQRGGRTPSLIARIHETSPTVLWPGSSRTARMFTWPTLRSTP